MANKTQGFLKVPRNWWCLPITAKEKAEAESEVIQPDPAPVAGPIFHLEDDGLSLCFTCAYWSISRNPTGRVFFFKLPVYRENENNSFDIEGPGSEAKGRKIQLYSKELERRCDCWVFIDHIREEATRRCWKSSFYSKGRKVTPWMSSVILITIEKFLPFRNQRN